MLRGSRHDVHAYAADDEIKNAFEDDDEDDFDNDITNIRPLADENDNGNDEDEDDEGDSDRPHWLDEDIPVEHDIIEGTRASMRVSHSSLVQHVYLQSLIKLHLTVATDDGTEDDLELDGDDEDVPEEHYDESFDDYDDSEDGGCCGLILAHSITIRCFF